VPSIIYWPPPPLCVSCNYYLLAHTLPGVGLEGGRMKDETGTPKLPAEQGR
jgi:hypothetical protein